MADNGELFDPPDKVTFFDFEKNMVRTLSFEEWATENPGKWGEDDPETGERSLTHEEYIEKYGIEKWRNGIRFFIRCNDEAHTNLALWERGVEKLDDLIVEGDDDETRKRKLAKFERVLRERGGEAGIRRKLHPET